jgi:hypothetical protein
MKIRYVYYDKKTGSIKEILHKRKRGRAPYIECDFEEVKGFITGTVGLNQYVVAYDKKQNKYVLMERNNVIRFRDIPKDLYKIPQRKNVESDLTISYYEDDAIEVSLDITRISPIAQTKFGKEILFEQGTEIRLVMKDKESDKTLKEIIIEAQKLLDDGSVIIDVPHPESGDPVFYTYKIFENYSWYRGSVRLLSPIKDKIKFHIHKADRIVKDKNFSYHLTARQGKKGITFENNVESLTLIKYRDPIDFYLVDRHDPNILYYKFSLDDTHLNKKNFEIETEFLLSGKTLLYNHKYISVFMEG